MTMTTITRCLSQVCDELNIPYEFMDGNQALMCLKFGSKRHFVINNTLGLNSDIHQHLMRDKYYAYRLLSPKIFMPVTYSYCDPDPSYKFFKHATFLDLNQIADDILGRLACPVIVKRNSGTQAKNVYLCQDRQQIQSALTRIYSKQQIEYDHVAIAQEYIKPKHEYRVIAFNGSMEFVYRKFHKRAEFRGGTDLELWNRETDDQLVEEETLRSAMQSMVTAVMNILPVRYTGMDVIEDEKGKLWLLEMNGSPLFSGYVERNDLAPLLNLFRKIVIYLKETYESGCPSIY